MERALSLKSKVSYGRYKDKSVEEIVAKNKAVIMKMIKDGYTFSDQVLKKVGLKKSIHGMKVSTQVVEHEKDTKTYAKDTKRVSEILNSLRTLDNMPSVYGMEPKDNEVESPFEV